MEARWSETDGQFMNRRQEDVRRKQAAASKAGKASVEARLQANGTAQPTPFRSNGTPNGRSNDYPNGTVNGARTESEQPPEPIRVQRTERTTENRTVPSGTESATADARSLFDAWNAITTAPVPKAEKLTKTRLRHARQRLSERPLAQWIAAIQRLNGTAFLRGDNDRGWRVSFDWLIANDENVTKLLEGKYDRLAVAPPVERPIDNDAWRRNGD
jgi:hypothetical protein